MNIMLIRHPVTWANVNGETYNKDDEIHPKGHKQIDELAERFREEKIDRLYSSDAPRCRKLAEKLEKVSGIRPEYSELFREIDNGILAGESKEKLNRFRLENNSDVAPENGESLDNLYERARLGKKRIQEGGGKRACLVSSGLLLKAFVGEGIGLDPKQALETLGFSNCALSEVSLDENNMAIRYLNNRDYLTTR